MLTFLREDMGLFVCYRCHSDLTNLKELWETVRLVCRVVSWGPNSFWESFCKCYLDSLNGLEGFLECDILHGNYLSRNFLYSF